MCVVKRRGRNYAASTERSVVTATACYDDPFFRAVTNSTLTDLSCIRRLVIAFKLELHRNTTHNQYPRYVRFVSVSLHAGTKALSQLTIVFISM